MLDYAIIINVQANASQLIRFVSNSYFLDYNWLDLPDF